MHSDLWRPENRLPSPLQFSYISYFPNMLNGVVLGRPPEGAGSVGWPLGGGAISRPRPSAPGPAPCDARDSPAASAPQARGSAGVRSRQCQGFRRDLSVPVWGRALSPSAEGRELCAGGVLPAVRRGLTGPPSLAPISRIGFARFPR